VVPGRFNVEERGAGMEAHTEDAVTVEERALAGVCRGNDRVRV
jgi:hypothetical protein